MSDTVIKSQYIEKVLNARKSKFTVTSKVTGEQMSFAFEEDKNNVSRTYVKVKHDSHAYRYIGVIDNTVMKETFTPILRDMDVAMQTLVWLMENRYNLKRLNEQVQIEHEGQCMRCGRKLTNPESINIGIGPECLKK